MLDHLTSHLRQGLALSDDQVAAAIVGLIDAAASVETKAEFLTALANKGETTAEIAAFARELRQRAVLPPVDAETRQREILDVCGTGGDGQNTFNVSTTVALIVASAGVTVAKHGNRAVTSRSGSADVLEELGIPIALSPFAAAASLREHHFAFFFAPNYHPAFRHITAARKLCAERRQRTIFNFLGQLLNPAQPSAQLVGVPVPTLCEPMALVLQSLGVRRGMVVCGRAGDGSLDELSTVGDSTVAEFYHARAMSVSLLAPGPFVAGSAQLSDLTGGDRQTNAQIIRALLNGSSRGPRRDLALLNAGAALFVAGRSVSISDGFSLAEELIDSGRAERKLKDLASLSR